MVQPAQACETAAMPRFRVIRHSGGPVYLGRAVFRFVVYPDDFYRIAALHLAQRPQAGQQMPFFIVSDQGYGDQWLFGLQSGQFAAHFFDDCCRCIGEGFPVDLQVFAVPFLHILLFEVIFLESVSRCAGYNCIRIAL